MAKKTQNKKVNTTVVDQLAEFLSDTYVLYIKTQNFHWNMAGPQFFMYHKLLEEQYKNMAEAIDEIAERIRMLGKKSPGSMHEFLSLAKIKESKPTLTQVQMISELTICHEALERHLLELIKFTENEGDPGTADLLIERVRFHSKQGWLLRSHLEKRNT